MSGALRPIADATVFHVDDFDDRGKLYVAAYLLGEEYEPLIDVAGEMSLDHDFEDPDTKIRRD